jgi:hypothetical protein
MRAQRFDWNAHVALRADCDVNLRALVAHALPHAPAMSEIERYRVGPSPLVSASASPDGLVLLDVRGGVILASNAIGARIWTLIEQHHSVAEIAKQLVAEYRVPEARAEHDVAAFVASLTDRGLITVERQC